MPNSDTTRRSFISSAAKGAAVVAPIALLGGCGTGGGATSVATVLDKLLGQAPLSSKTEADVWQTAIGQSFRLGSDTGPVYASLTSVTAQSAGGDRPDELRQQPLLLSFTVDAGYRVPDEAMFQLDRSMASQWQLFMQRGTTANGAAELVALLN
jgi:hypothetical protein